MRYSRWGIDIRDFPETKAWLKKRYDDAGKKWDTNAGKALENVISLLDNEFCDSIITTLLKEERKQESKANELYKKEKELKEREDKLIERERANLWKFENQSFGDAYKLGEAMKESLKSPRGELSDEIKTRILEMVENLAKGAESIRLIPNKK